MKPRALRRWKLGLMKAKASKRHPENPKAYIDANHMAGCSCLMCGNPRRHTGIRTIQERKAMQDDHDAS